MNKGQWHSCEGTIEENLKIPIRKWKFKVHFENRIQMPQGAMSYRAIVWRLWPIAVGDTKWDRVIKIWGIHSHEWHYQPRAHVVTLIYIKIWTYDTWLIKYTPRLPDNLGCFVFNVNFLIVDYFYLRIRYLMKITLMILICDKMWMFKFS